MLKKAQNFQQINKINKYIHIINIHNTGKIIPETEIKLAEMQSK